MLRITIWLRAPVGGTACVNAHSDRSARFRNIQRSITW